MTPKRVAMALLALALVGCGSEDALSAPVSATPKAPSSDIDCAAAAEQWGGTVAAAFPATVEEVRAYMGRPHGAAEDTTALGADAYVYPTGWDGLDDHESAAACYLDGAVPKGPPATVGGTEPASFDRRLVIVARGVPSFMVSAGTKASMLAEPLSAFSD